MSFTPTPFERLLPVLRGRFPQVQSLRNGKRRIYLDSAAGTLVPQSVADAMAEAALWANPQPGRGWTPAEEVLREHRRMRADLADFLNATVADRFFLSESTTSSLYKLRESLEPEWGPETNVVVTDCDHFANISPWEWRARWQVRRARMLPDGHLDLDHLAEQLDSRTRIVAVTLASNGLGTRIRVEEAFRLARERAPETVCVLDAVHAAPHVPMDVAGLGADALAFSAYKLFGPFAGILWISERIWSRLHAYRVEPHTDPETLLEWGTLNNVAVAGTRACLEYLRGIGERLEGAFVGRLTGYPRERRLYKVALTAMQEYEAGLSRQVLEGLRGLEGVTLHGIREPERAGERVPTFAYTVPGVEDAEVERRLWEWGGLQTAAGNHYAASVLRGLGLPGAGRASFSHYNTPEEAGAFLEGLRQVVGR